MRLAAQANLHENSTSALLPKAGNAAILGHVRANQWREKEER